MSNNAHLAQLQILKHGRDRYPTISMQALKLVEEVGELAKEVNRGLPNVEKVTGELADVALALYNLAAKCRIDLDTAIESKVESDTRDFR